MLDTAKEQRYGLLHMDTKVLVDKQILNSSAQCGYWMPSKGPKDR